MATAKKTNGTAKMTIAETRAALEKANALLDDGFKCFMCDTTKKKEKFHMSTDPYNKTGVVPICKLCAEKIARRADKNGEFHEPTKESVQLALRYENKPFLESVWNAAIQETENLLSGKVRSNVWASYCHLIAMSQYIGLTYFDSDTFKERIVYDDEKTEKEIIDEHIGLDTYDSYLKNKSDVVRLLDYDPFEKEALSDQPFLYSQLLGMLDANGEGNDDMMRTSSAISIVRGFLQSAKLDDTISKLMSDITNIEKNSATIKSLQDSKQKLTNMIKVLAEESCISLAHSKHSLKGENTWTGKIKKIKDLNLRDGQVNGFDIGTCRGMQQVLELSDAAIMKQLALDESEWSDMVAELREQRVNLQRQLDTYIEINRILLQENLDLKDYLEENGIDITMNLRDLKDVYSPFSSIEMEDNEYESDNPS